MASISSPGIGSGLDVNSLVSQLVAAERAPSDQRFARLESTTKAQISAFGAIKSAVTGLHGALKRFDGLGAALGRKVTVGADAGFSATAGTSARNGIYQVSVERLATAHKLQSMAAGKDDALGAGRLSISVGADAPIVVDIAEGKSTLADIRDAINAATAGKGLSATIIRGNQGDVLTLTSARVGTAGRITIDATGSADIAALATTGGSLSEIAAAQDAEILVDGIRRSVSGNTVDDAIDGITINLEKAKPGETFKLDVAADASPLKATLLSFVSAYNTALTQLRTQSAAGGEGKVAGALSGDAAPRSIMQGLRNAMTSAYGDLSTLGFKTATDGSLSLDGAIFDKAIATDPEAVQRLVGENAPLGRSLRGMLEGYTSREGMLESRSGSLNDRMKSLTRDRERFEVRMESVEAAYRRQFTALDGLMSKLTSTSSYLSQQLASLSAQTSS